MCDHHVFAQQVCMHLCCIHSLQIHLLDTYEFIHHSLLNYSPRPCDPFPCTRLTRFWGSTKHQGKKKLLHSYCMHHSRLYLKKIGLAVADSLNRKLPRNPFLYTCLTRFSGSLRAYWCTGRFPWTTVMIFRQLRGDILICGEITSVMIS